MQRTRAVPRACAGLVVLGFGLTACGAGAPAERQADDRSGHDASAAGTATPRAGMPAANGPAPHASDAPANAEPAVPIGSGTRPGIAVLLEDSLHLVRGIRVGLITNHTGVIRFEDAGRAETTAPDDEGESTIDLLHAHPDIELAALFGPEHAIHGRAEAGERVASGRDPRTGLPVYSLYGETREPPDTALAGLDALLFDIQDIGARYYTYVWTMALAMRAAAERGVRFIVLDRPNPIGGTHVQGNILEPRHATFVGLYPVPMRHGLTAGELALLLNAEHGIGADLVVVPAAGWRRSMWYDRTGLAWIPPSPNMPSLESATHYPGTCLFEGTNLSVGRGTPEAFRQIGAPWLEHDDVARAFTAHDVPGVRIEPVTFTPDRPGDGKFAGRRVRGLRLTVTDREAYDPVLAAVVLLVEIRRRHAGEFEWLTSHFDRLAGTASLRRQVDAGTDPRRVLAGWESDLARFLETRERYLLYPE